MADRLSADREYIELARNKITAKNILGFKNGDNTDIYMLAFALGVNAGVRTPSTHKEGFILETVARGFDKYPAMSYIYSVALQVLIEENRENEITDTEVVFGIAEAYANTGFKIISEMIPDFSKYDEEIFIYELIDKIDTKMDELEVEREK